MTALGRFLHGSLVVGFFRSTARHCERTPSPRSPDSPFLSNLYPIGLTLFSAEPNLFFVVCSEDFPSFSEKASVSTPPFSVRPSRASFRPSCPHFKGSAPPPPLILSPRPVSFLSVSPKHVHRLLPCPVFPYVFLIRVSISIFVLRR